MRKGWEPAPRVASAPVPEVFPPQLVAGHDFQVSSANLKDLHFILDSWCSNQAQWSASHHGQVDKEVFKVEMRARVMRILQDAKCAIIRPTVMLNKRLGHPHREEEILTWAVYDYDRKTDAPVVHFIYTVHSARRRKLASLLLHRAAGVRENQTWWATHTSHMGKPFMRLHGGTYNPFLLECLPELKKVKRI